MLGTVTDNSSLESVYLLPENRNNQSRRSITPVSFLLTLRWRVAAQYIWNSVVINATSEGRREKLGFEHETISSLNVKPMPNRTPSCHGNGRNPVEPLIAPASSSAGPLALSSIAHAAPAPTVIGSSTGNAAATLDDL